MRNIVHTKKLLQDNRRGLRKSIASNQRRIMLPTGLAIAIYRGKRRKEKAVMKKKLLNK